MVTRLATQIVRRLEAGGSECMGILERAAFRVKMRRGWFDGAAYLMRLSFSPTEEDWAAGEKENRSWLLDAMGRPFRLARKYGRDSRREG
jgi:hypothetical protein